MEWRRFVTYLSNDPCMSKGGQINDKTGDYSLPTPRSTRSSTVSSLFFVRLSPHPLKSQIILIATHLLSSGINFLTHCTNPILLIPCLSHRNHHAVFYHPSSSSPLSSSITPSLFLLQT